MNNWHPWTLKKSKPWGLFWSYQLNSTANSAHLALCHKIQFWLNISTPNLQIQVKWMQVHLLRPLEPWDPWDPWECVNSGEKFISVQTATV